MQTFSGQFNEKRVSIRERNIKSSLETVTYKAIAQTVTCIITIETVMYIMYCRKYHLRSPTESPTCIKIKIVTHIFAAETVPA